MSTGLVGVRDAIVAVVAGVTGIGRVYGYQRLVTSEEELDADLVHAGILHYWCISPSEGEPCITERHPGTHGKAVYQFDVHGYYALADKGETEQTFTALTLAVMAAFEVGDKKLGGLVTECRGAQWREHNRALPCNVLCHHVRLSIWCSEHPSS